MKGVKIKAATKTLQTNDSNGNARVSNHDGCDVSGWSVVKMLMRVMLPNVES